MVSGYLRTIHRPISRIFSHWIVYYVDTARVRTRTLLLLIASLYEQRKKEMLIEILSSALLTNLEAARADDQSMNHDR